jgi:hypothetical protein
VVVVDARGVATGASGRNLGWVSPRTYVNFAEGVESYGLQEIVDEVVFEHGVASELYSLAELNGWIEDVEIVQGGHMYQSFYSSFHLLINLSFFDI